MLLYLASKRKWYSNITKKGSQLYVEGRIRTNKWQDQNGQDKYTTEIVANSIQLMGDKSQSNNQPPVDSYEQNQPQRPSSQPVNNNYAQAKGGKPSHDDFDDDDSPPF